MQSGGFGKKGLGAGAAYPQQGAIAAPRFAAPDPSIAAKRAAFLADERGRVDGNGLAGLRNSEPTPFQEDEEIDPEEVLRETYYRSDAKKKSMLLDYVLWYFGGPVSAHRFYLGATSSAIKARGPWPAPRNFSTYSPSSSASTMAGSEPPSRSGVT